MGFQQLSNCPKCGKLFVKGIKDVCNDCYKHEEEEYKTVSGFLRIRENRKATLNETSEQTGVSVKQITKFIRQGRISLDGLPNLGLLCEMCGKLSRDGHICPNCRERLTKKVEGFVSTEEKRLEMEKYKVKDIGYYQLKEDKKDR